VQLTVATEIFMNNQQAVEKQPAKPMEGLTKSRTSLQVLDFMSMTETRFRLAGLKKSKDGLFQQPADGFDLDTPFTNRSRGQIAPMFRSQFRECSNSLELKNPTGLLFGLFQYLRSIRLRTSGNLYENFLQFCFGEYLIEFLT
jgi:hypothetical protein